jgi:hypothetical protein
MSNLQVYGLGAKVISLNSDVNKQHEIFKNLKKQPFEGDKPQYRTDLFYIKGKIVVVHLSRT